MEKRERLEKTVAGEPTDRVPVALWRHWPGDDQRAADLARSTLDFQRAFDWDIVQVVPARSYSVADYGLGTVWEGHPSGDRTLIKQPIRRSLDWTELRTLDPLRGEVGKYLSAVSLVRDGLGTDDVPVMAVVYSPMSQAAMMAADDLLLRNLRTHPDRLETGLNILTESTMMLIDALKRTGIDGICYVVDHACFSLMSRAEYETFGAAPDRRILEALPSKWWLNIVSLQSPAPMFELAATYPIKALHWDIPAGQPDLDKAWPLFDGMFCGGFSNTLHLERATPAGVRDVARDLINHSGGDRKSVV